MKLIRVKCKDFFEQKDYDVLKKQVFGGQKPLDDGDHLEWEWEDKNGDYHNLQIYYDDDGRFIVEDDNGKVKTFENGPVSKILTYINSYKKYK